MTISGDDRTPRQYRSKQQRISDVALYLQQIGGGELEDAMAEAAQREPDYQKPYNDGDLLAAGFRETAQHNYTDLDGKLLYQVVRYEHKSVKGAKMFRQRRPDPDGRWLASAGLVKVPYRWRALATRTTEDIFYCEGEKNADLLSDKGLLASTCASQKWTRTIADAYANRDVYVLADADETGEENALEAERWLRGVNATVRIVRLPGLLHSEDVHDWLTKHGHGVEELVAFAKAQHQSGLRATAARLPDPKTIPTRQWLYKPHYVRQIVSATVSTGGIGKSTLVIAEALAMASGKALHGTTPRGKLKVWYWNGEDPTLELERRVAATMKHYGLSVADAAGGLFVDSGRETPIAIAADDGRGIKVNDQLIREMTQTIATNKIDVAIIDPFISSHRVRENDNVGIERVVKSLAGVAEATNCSIMVVHHTRKTGDALTVDDARGASALVDAVRTARVLNTMSEHDADLANIDEAERRLHFRSDNGKTNLTRPAEHADWFKLESVDLENDASNSIEDDSDKVGVATAWLFPEVEEVSATTADVVRAQDKIRSDGPWRRDQQSESEPWVGVAIAEVLGVDLRRKPIKRAVAKMVKAWIRAGLLKTVTRPDARRKPRSYVEAGSPPATESIVSDLPEGVAPGTGLGISDDPADNLYRRRS
jgi:hypothetical protein